MQVKVKLFATFRNGRGKEVNLEMKPGATVRDILKLIDIKEDEIAILLVNGKDGKFDTVLEEGDYLSLFPPVGGG